MNQTDTVNQVYKVKQVATGTTLWVGGAENAAGALDAMAREAGYADYAALPREIGDAQAFLLPAL